MARPTYYVACQDCNQYITLGQWGHVHDTQHTHAFFTQHDGHRYTIAQQPEPAWREWGAEFGPCVRCKDYHDSYAPAPERWWGVPVCPECWNVLADESDGTLDLRQRLQRLQARKA